MTLLQEREQELNEWADKLADYETKLMLLPKAHELRWLR